MSCVDWGTQRLFRVSQKRRERRQPITMSELDWPECLLARKTKPAFSFGEPLGHLANESQTKNRCACVSL